MLAAFDPQEPKQPAAPLLNGYRTDKAVVLNWAAWLGRMAYLPPPERVMDGQIETTCEQNLDPRIRRTIEESGIHLMSYGDYAMTKDRCRPD